MKTPIIGLVENMKMDKSENVELGTRKLGLRYLGEIQFDPQVENAIGKEERLLQTAVGKALQKIVKNAILAEKREH